MEAGHVQEPARQPCGSGRRGKAEDAVGPETGCYCGDVGRKESSPSEGIANLPRRDFFVMQFNPREAIRLPDFGGEEIGERGRPKIGIADRPDDGLHAGSRRVLPVG